MKGNHLLLLLLVLFLAGCIQNQTGEKIVEAESIEVAEPVSDGLFLHISSGYDNPKKVLMALTLANKVKGMKDVTLFFDVEGVRILKEGAKDIDMKAYMPLQESLDNLVAAGVPIMACPMCLKAAGIEKEMLREGVEIATVDGFYNFTEGRILTLDY